MSDCRDHHLSYSFETRCGKPLITTTMYGSTMPLHIETHGAVDEVRVYDVASCYAHPLEVWASSNNIELEMVQNLCTARIFWDSLLYFLVQSVMAKLMRDEALHVCSDCGVYDLDLKVDITTRHGAYDKVLASKSFLQRRWGKIGLSVFDGVTRYMRWDTERLRRERKDSDLALEVVLVEGGWHQRIDYREAQLPVLRSVSRAVSYRNGGKYSYDHDLFVRHGSWMRRKAGVEKFC